MGLPRSVAPKWSARPHNHPVIHQIAESDVWDERNEERPGPDDRAEGREDAAYLA